jgi:SAM-dependent methyltransferase
MFTKSAAFYDEIYSFKDYVGEANRVKELVAERAPQAHTLLDVACGTGTHLQHLQDRFEVSGVDLDSNLLSLARHRLPTGHFHHADMATFDLHQEFDVVQCLFSSIGYMESRESLFLAVRNFAKHTASGGLILVEPWLYPDAYKNGHVHGLFVDKPELKIARMSIGGQDGDVSVITFRYLIATPAGFEDYEETHRLGLFPYGIYERAFLEAGLIVDYDPIGLMNRGLFMARKP